MKKLMSILSVCMLMSISTITIPIVSKAQSTAVAVVNSDTASPGDTAVGPTNPIPWDGNSLPTTMQMIRDILATTFGYVMLIIFVTGYVIRITQMSNDTAKAITSWVMAFLIGWGAKYLGYGIFAGVDWANAVLLACLGGFAANKIFDSKTMDNILVFWGSLSSAVRDARKGK